MLVQKQITTFTSVGEYFRFLDAVHRKKLSAAGIVEQGNWFNGHNKNLDLVIEITSYPPSKKTPIGSIVEQLHRLFDIKTQNI